MADIIKTVSVGRNFVKTEGVLLEQTPNTALVFFPEIHPGGVRGDLIRFKKNRDDEWEKISEQDFKKLQLYEGTHIELGTQQLDKLLVEVKKRKSISEQGVQSGSTEYVVAEKDKVIVIDDENKKELIQQILDKGYSRDFWELVSKSNPSLASSFATAHRHNINQKEIKNLEKLLNLEKAGNIVEEILKDDELKLYIAGKSEKNLSKLDRAELMGFWC